MADILLDGLPVLDLLEITPSTSAVARITRRDQSSISRIYRQVSRRLGLGFRKDDNGSYSAASNQSLLEGLRLSSQWLRLQGEQPEPRWLNGGLLSSLPEVPFPALPPQLVGRCDNIQQLLRDRVLDLAVIQRTAETESTAPHATLQELPLLRHRKGEDLLMLRIDLADHAVIQQLVATIRSAYRQHQPG